jgi:DNA-binding transcriptional MocR family regulator
MKDLLFIDTANKIARLINNHTYQAGEKLPSLRTVQKQYGISIGTAIEAYNYLADKGLLVSKEKSGYFVAPPVSTAALPKATTLSLKEQTAQINNTLQRALHESTGRNFISFFNAVPPLELLPVTTIKRSLQNASRDLTASYIHYEPSKGNLALRKLIAQQSFQWKGQLTADDIVITNGALEAIQLCLRAITKPGDTVLIESPCYFGILQCLEQLGLKVVEIPSHSEEGINLEHMQQVCRQFQVKACLLISNFNNPNGALLSAEKKQQVARFAKANSIPVIDDDIYGDLYFDNARPANIKAYDQDGWVLLCSSFSKTLAPGFRIGWCAPGRFIRQVEQLKAVTNIATAGIVQQSLCELLQTGAYDRHMRKMRINVQKQLFLTAQAIEQYFPEGTRISRPKGGFVLWIELPKKINAFQFQKVALQQQIDIAPGPIFSNKGAYTNYIRISCQNTWSKKVEAAIKKLGAIAQHLNS